MSIIDITVNTSLELPQCKRMKLKKLRMAPKKLPIYLMNAPLSKNDIINVDTHAVNNLEYLR
jgi:hypothetical protein